MFLDARSYRSDRDINSTAVIDQLKIKKDDYWNRIVAHNTKLHEIEKRQAIENKKNSQLKMRQMLQEQQAMQRSISNDQNEQEQKILNEINRKNYELQEKERLDKINYR